MATVYTCHEYDVDLPRNESSPMKVDAGLSGQTAAEEEARGNNINHNNIATAVITTLCITHLDGGSLPTR